MKYKAITFNIHVEGPAQSGLSAIAHELICATAGEAGFESFEDADDTLVGYIPSHLYDASTLESLLAEIPLEGLSVTLHATDIDDTDWNAAWEEEGFEPIRIGNRCVIHDTTHLPLPTETFDTDIVIDTKMAFGTGTHATTHMMVEALCEEDLTGKRVLDCGCGTGILSIAALRMGAAEAVGYDIDEWSVRNALHNARLNHVERLDVLLGDRHVLSHVNGLFHLIMANINRNILLDDMPGMRDVLAHDGKIFLSGFYEDDVALLEEKAHSLGMEIKNHRHRDGWVMLEIKDR